MQFYTEIICFYYDIELFMILWESKQTLFRSCWGILIFRQQSRKKLNHWDDSDVLCDWNDLFCNKNIVNSFSNQKFCFVF